jgi:hypothetical protein
VEEEVGFIPQKLADRLKEYIREKKSGAKREFSSQAKLFKEKIP